MYIREIPEEYRKEVLEIMERNSTILLFSRPDLERLFYLYYRYVKVLKPYEQFEKLMKNDLNCRACKGKVIMYFKNIVHEW